MNFLKAIELFCRRLDMGVSANMIMTAPMNEKLVWRGIELIQVWSRR